MLDVDKMERYISPINPAIYPHLSAVLLIVGIFYTAWFLVYQVTTSRHCKSLVKEFSLAAVSSVFMGFGVMFLALTVGISI